jgi:hypothetical protein
VRLSDITARNTKALVSLQRGITAIGLLVLLSGAIGIAGIISSVFPEFLKMIAGLVPDRLTSDFNIKAEVGKICIAIALLIFVLFVARGRIGGGNVSSQE